MQGYIIARPSECDPESSSIRHVYTNLKGTVNHSDPHIYFLKILFNYDTVTLVY